MSTRSWFCLQHVDVEGPALVSDLLRRRGLDPQVFGWIWARPSPDPTSSPAWWFSAAR